MWLAEDSLLCREVAIKTPHAYGHRQESSGIIIREASAAARLRHPNILPVYEVNESRGRWFIVTEYVSGGTLRQFLGSQKISCEDVAKFGAQLADALHHAHSHGIYHRDLKPSNVLVDDGGNLLIADFGLAVRPSRSPSKWRARSVERQPTWPPNRPKRALRWRASRHLLVGSDSRGSA